MTLTKCLSEISDHRRAEGKRFNMIQMFSIIFISGLCGHFGGRAVSRFAESHMEIFVNELSLKHGTPSHTKISTFINAISEENMIAVFHKWTSSYVVFDTEEGVSGDGKALKSTRLDNRGKNFKAIVSFFSHKNGLVHSISKYENEKKSEVNVVLALLDRLKDMGITLHLDALHCQKKTIEKIVATGNDYVVQVKRNQKTLHEEIQRVIVEEEPIDTYEEHEKGHGRHSSWYVTVFDATNSKKVQEWERLTRMIHVHKKTVCTKTKKESHNDRFYISNKKCRHAIDFHRGIRGHWTIENSLHWVKDVVHKEDANQIRTNNGPINSAIISTIVINIHRKNGIRSITDSQIKFGANVKELFDFFFKQ